MNLPVSDPQHTRLRELELELELLYKEVGAYCIMHRVLDWLLEDTYDLTSGAKQALVARMKEAFEEIRA